MDRKPLTLALDKHGAFAHMVITGMGAIFVCMKAYSGHHFHKLMLVLLLMGFQAAIALLLYTCASRQSDFYWGHRLACVVLAQMLQFFSDMQFMPWAFDVAWQAQLNDGKHWAMTANLLLFGCASFSIFLQVLSARLPWSLAAPFAAVKLVVALHLLPYEMGRLTTPVLVDILATIRMNIDYLYTMVAAAAAGVNVVHSPEVMPVCPHLSLALWAHFALGGLVPLYMLAVFERSSKHQPADMPVVESEWELSGPQQLTGYGASMGSTTADALASVAILEPLDSGSDRGTSMFQRAGSSGSNSSLWGSSSDMLAAIMTSSDSYGPGHGYLPWTQQQPIRSHPDLWANTVCACAYHGTVLVGASMLLLAVIDVAVAHPPLLKWVTQHELCI